MEVEPPVVGREGKFAAHLTEMTTFKPLTRGTMTVVLQDGGWHKDERAAPLSPQARVFSAHSFGRPKRANAPNGHGAEFLRRRERFEAGPCEVFSDVRRRGRCGRQRSRRGPARSPSPRSSSGRRICHGGRVPARAPAGREANAEIRPVAGRRCTADGAVTGRVSLAMPPPRSSG